MDAEKLKRYGTIALIAIFVIEIIAFLFTSNPYEGAIPTPSPTPTAIPEEFAGLNATEGYVLGFAPELLAVCNTTADLDPIISNIAGVQAASFDPSTGRIGLSIGGGNASADDVAKELRARLQGSCTPIIFKRAYVRFGEALNFSDGAGKSKILFPGSLQCLQQPTFAQCFAFVNPSTKENSTTDFIVFIRMRGELIELISAEEQRQAAPIEFGSAQGEARIAELLLDCAAVVEIPWGRRNAFSEESAAAALNSSLNITQTAYQKASSFEVNGSDNGTYALLGNLSFVSSASQDPGTGKITVQLQENYGNDSEMLAALESIGISSGEITFPPSQFALAFTIEQGTSPAESESIIRRHFSGLPVSFRWQVLVELVSPDQVEEQLGAQLEQTSFELFARNATINSTIPISIGAVLQDGVITFMQAQEITPEDFA